MFKTATERARKVFDGPWYLYNIIASASVYNRKDFNAVFFRTLITGFSKEAYEAVFYCFFAELVEARDRIRGDRSGSGCRRVAYIPMSKKNESRAVTVRSFTADFDAAEALGYCESVSLATSGSVGMHMENGMVGHSVQLDRDLLMHSRGAEVLNASGITSTKLLQKHTKFEEQASAALNKIRVFDEQWVHWVKSSKMEHMICHAKSKMTSASRKLGYFDTNAVEPLNRREILLSGHITHHETSQSASQNWT